MKLSISNIAWSDQEDRQVYDLMNKYGFRGLEIAPTRLFDNPYYASQELIERKKNQVKKFGLKIIAMQSLHYGKTNISLFDNLKKRKAMLEYSKKAVLFAEKIGASSLIFGSPKLRNCKDYINDYKIGVDFFRDLGDFAYNHNSYLCIEANPKEYNTNFINNNTEALSLVKDVNSKGFKLHIDCGTIILNEENLDIIDNAVGYLKHIHISSPFLREINPLHQELHIKLYNKLLNIKYNNWISIEMRKVEKDNLKNIESCLKYVSNIFKGGNN